MRHVTLTCRNHPDLRWSCKEIAITNGRYNGQRNIFFDGHRDGGELILRPCPDALLGFAEGYLVDGIEHFECKCSARHLIVIEPTLV